MKSIIVGFLSVFALNAKAETIYIECKPVAFLNQATLSAVLTKAPTSASVTVNGKLQRTGEGYKAFSVASVLTGHIDEGTGIPEADGTTNHFSTFYATSDSGDIRRVELSFGDDVGVADSFVQTKDGYYYRANCERK